MRELRYFHEDLIVAMTFRDEKFYNVTECCTYLVTKHIEWTSLLFITYLIHALREELGRDGVFQTI